MSVQGFVIYKEKVNRSRITLALNLESSLKKGET